MNHSCNPCAQIVGHEYVDYYIDCKALREINQGEEITISYLDLGSNPSSSSIAKNKRSRELRSRYLFECSCERCVQIENLNNFIKNNSN